MYAVYAKVMQRDIVFMGRLRFPTLSQQVLSSAQVSLAGSHHEGSAALLVRHVDIGSVVQQQINYLWQSRNTQRSQQTPTYS